MSEEKKESVFYVYDVSCLFRIILARGRNCWEILPKFSFPLATFILVMSSTESVVLMYDARQRTSAFLPRLALRMCSSNVFLSLSELCTTYNEHSVSRFRTGARGRRESKNEKVNVFDVKAKLRQLFSIHALSLLLVYLCLSDNDDKYTSGKKRESLLPSLFEFLTISFLSSLFSPLNFVIVLEQQPSAVEVTLSFTPSFQGQRGEKKRGKKSVITNSRTRETTSKKSTSWDFVYNPSSQRLYHSTTFSGLKSHSQTDVRLDIVFTFILLSLLLKRKTSSSADITFFTPELRLDGRPIGQQRLETISSMKNMKIMRKFNSETV